MGIETGGFKWSPVSLRYDKWAGLYQEDHQFLYVNRGFGFLGYPGRIGIWPEITIMTLLKA
jgi:predicted MPP superfamily phosphohydrolase